MQTLGVELTILMNLWSFSNNSFEKYMMKTFGASNMTILYQNLFNNEVC